MAIDVIGHRVAAGLGMAAVILAASLVAASPAEARHRHHGRVVAVYP
jgi:hypothetical protein